jgi:methyl-accepting chemotaxis protein
VKVDQVATAIRAITEETNKVKTLVDEVNLGSQEQARGIDQVSHVIVQMDEVTQKTAANAEESAAAAKELTAQAVAVNDIIGRLRTMVGGESGGTIRQSVPVPVSIIQAKDGLPAATAQTGKESFPLDDDF